jgi:hypothetical protein
MISSRSCLRWAAIGVIALASGCGDLNHFTTGPDESYCGAVTLGAEFRQGLSPRVQMRLDLNAAAIDVDGASAGHITTYEVTDPSKPPTRLLHDAVLRPIPPLYHDTLSQLDFGNDNLKSTMFAVSPADPTAESLLAVVSLRSDDSVEVRLIRPGVAGTTDDVPEGRRPIYALFPLTKQKGLCGF